jgi:phosphoglycolate phosphatase
MIAELDTAGCEPDYCMAKLAVGNRVVDVDLVAFDKDGTLIDFHHLWGRKARLWVEDLARASEGRAALPQSLYRTLGYDEARERVVADGPLAVASMQKLYTLAAGVLYQHGVPWHEAEQIVEDSVSRSIGALPAAELVRPLGDFPALVSRLRGVGVEVAVITSDDRAATLATLDLLGVPDTIAHVVCGDDDLPNKPAPDGILHLCACYGVRPERVMLVGDTVSDMLTGANAGVACRVAILNGAGDTAALVEHADVVIESIDEIRVADPSAT